MLCLPLLCAVYSIKFHSQFLEMTKSPTSRISKQIASSYTTSERAENGRTSWKIDMYHIAPTYNQYHAQSLPSPHFRLDMLY